MTNRMIDVLILGGGVSGCLAAERLMQDFPDAHIQIIDKGDVTIHPFHLHRLIPEISSLANLKPAMLHVNIWDGKEFKSQPSLMDINRYSMKIVGHVQINNLYSHGSIQIYPVEKDTLMHPYKKMRDEITSIDIKNNTVISRNEYYNYKYLINTIPLPNFLGLCKINHDIEFINYPIYTSRTLIHKTNMYQMIYNTDRKSHLTRITLLDDELYIEANDEFKAEEIHFLNDFFGLSDILITPLHRIYPGKIKPIPNEQRKALFYWLTQRYDIFCLGRYGAWTGKVANDVWDDTKQISNWIYAKVQAHKFEEGMK